jgi:hypothetical protein
MGRCRRVSIVPEGASKGVLNRVQHSLQKLQDEVIYKLQKSLQEKEH